MPLYTTMCRVLLGLANDFIVADLAPGGDDGKFSVAMLTPENEMMELGLTGINISLIVFSVVFVLFCFVLFYMVFYTVF